MNIDQPDLLSQFMYILSKNVNFLKQHHIFLHNSGIFLFVDILIFLKHLSQIVYIVFKVLSFISVFAMEICISLLILDFFFHVFLVKSDNTFLKFFEIGNMMKALKNIVLKLLFKSLLLIKALSQMSDLVCETFLSHSQIINDQSKILIDSIEVFQFLSHFVCLLIQLLDFDFSGSNVTLKLLDLVIKDEFKLLKFLSFLFEVIYSLVLVFYCGFSLLDLTLLRVDLLFERVSLLNEFIQSLKLFINVLLCGFFISLCALVVIGH